MSGFLFGGPKVVKSNYFREDFLELLSESI